MFTYEDVMAAAADSRELLRAREIIVGQRLRIVHLLGGHTGVLRAEVRGSGVAVYRVSVDEQLAGTCTCPFFRKTTRRHCKHVTALALTWLEAPIAVECLDPEVARAIAAMDELAVRALLAEACGRWSWVRERVITGEWPE